MAMLGAFGLAALASATLMASLLGHDFSIAYVARNNATTTPPFTASSACGPRSRARSSSGRSS